MDPPRLLGYVCLGCNVTTELFWHILMRLGFWAYWCIEFSISHSFSVSYLEELTIRGWLLRSLYWFLEMSFHLSRTGLAAGLFVVKRLDFLMDKPKGPSARRI